MLFKKKLDGTLVLIEGEDLEIYHEMKEVDDAWNKTRNPSDTDTEEEDDETKDETKDETGPTSFTDSSSEVHVEEEEEDDNKMSAMFYAIYKVTQNVSPLMNEKSRKRFYDQPSVCFNFIPIFKLLFRFISFAF